MLPGFGVKHGDVTSYFLAGPGHVTRVLFRVAKITGSDKLGTTFS